LAVRRSTSDWVGTQAEHDVAAIWPAREPARRTRLLAILNLTPDSFHDGGRDASVEAAIRRGRALVDAGADGLDLGAESSRPGAAPVSEDEELARLLPVLEGVRELGVPVSVDTVKSRVAERALAAGASIVNDISGLRADPEMGAVCARAGCPVILMHMRGSPRDMQSRTDYDDVIAETRRFLDSAVESAVAVGIAEERIVLDPGIGFAKTAEQNLEILRRLDEYSESGRPILVGASRKSFLGRFGGRDSDDRLEATLAVSAWAVARGASVLRVHDVVENLRVVRATEAILSASARASEETC
jgi:dihydropteroate synthase